MIPLPPLPIFSPVSAYANDIALVIYTIAVIIWGSVFALFFRKKWNIWRHWHKEGSFTLDEWILIGLMLVGLVLGLVYMLTFLHGRPPGIRSLSEGL